MNKMIAAPLGSFLMVASLMGMEVPETGMRIAWGFADCQGLRDEMEDQHSAHMPLVWHKNDALFGVFDGHAGVDTAWYVAHHLPKIFKPSFDADKEKNVKLIKDAFEEIDQEAMNRSPSGSTAAVAYIQKDDVGTHKAYFAWTGDSRIMHCDAHCDDIKFVSRDHKPHNIEEMQRIVRCNGTVVMAGCYRVNGILAMSRAFGNRDLKQESPGAVIVEPDIEVKNIEPGDIILIACDGFWDVVSPQVACALIKALITGFEGEQLVREGEVQLMSGSDHDDSDSDVTSQSSDSTSDKDWGIAHEHGNDAVFIKVARFLREIAYNKGSTDNISVMVMRVSF